MFRDIFDTILFFFLTKILGFSTLKQIFSESHFWDRDLKFWSNVSSYHHENGILMYFYVIYVATDPFFDISFPKLSYGPKRIIFFLNFPAKITHSIFRRLFGGQMIKV